MLARSNNDVHFGYKVGRFCLIFALNVSLAFFAPLCVITATARSICAFSAQMGPCLRMPPILQIAWQEDAKLDLPTELQSVIPELDKTHGAHMVFSQAPERDRGESACISVLALVRSLDCTNCRSVVGSILRSTRDSFYRELKLAS